MEYKIPLFDLNFDEAEERAVVDTLRSKWISTGPKTAEFESKFASMLNVPHAVALANCTVALHLAMKLVGIHAGDEVICPSLTFVATANAIRYVDAIPVFTDIKSYEDLTIDPLDIENKITKKTKAIVVMHYGGFACDMDGIMAIAQKHKLKVIEDACHGPMSVYKGKKLGTIGDVGCFSYYSNKNISTGEGGMLVTGNSEYDAQAKLLRSHGMTSLSYERAKGHSSSYDVVDLGFNYRMDDIRATLGIIQLDKLEKDLRWRAAVKKMYIEQLNGIVGITIPFSDYREFASNYIFPILINKNGMRNRDQIRGQLAEAGIQTSVHYQAVHRFSTFKRFYRELPRTDFAAEHLITLPMYGKLAEESIAFITAKLREILK